MWVVHQRMAELWYRHCYGEGIDRSEIEELKICMDAHMRKAQRLADLENLSLMASMIKDTDWLHKICKEIDTVKEEMYGV